MGQYFGCQRISNERNNVRNQKMEIAKVAIIILVLQAVR